MHTFRHDGHSFLRTGLFYFFSVFAFLISRMSLIKKCLGLSQLFKILAIWDITAILYWKFRMSIGQLSRLPISISTQTGGDSFCDLKSSHPRSSMVECTPQETLKLALSWELDRQKSVWGFLSGHSAAQSSRWVESQVRIYHSHSFSPGPRKICQPRGHPGQSGHHAGNIELSITIFFTS